MGKKLILLLVLTMTMTLTACDGSWNIDSLKKNSDNSQTEMILGDEESIEGVYTISSLEGYWYHKKAEGTPLAPVISFTPDPAPAEDTGTWTSYDELGFNNPMLSGTMAVDSNGTISMDTPENMVVLNISEDGESLLSKDSSAYYVRGETFPPPNYAQWAGKWFLATTDVFNNNPDLEYYQFNNDGTFVLRNETLDTTILGTYRWNSIAEADDSSRSTLIIALQGNDVKLKEESLTLSQDGKTLATSSSQKGYARQVKD